MKPSTSYDGFWIYTRNREKDYPEHTVNGGKWLLFVLRDEIDGIWAAVERLMADGNLGSSAKVSTAMAAENRGSSATGVQHVICVYTYDWRDEADVMRVRDALRSIGFNQPIPYKADADTRAGNYAGGEKKVSKYYL